MGEDKINIAGDFSELQRYFCIEDLRQFINPVVFARQIDHAGLPFQFLLPAGPLSSWNLLHKRHEYYNRSSPCLSYSNKAGKGRMNSGKYPCRRTSVHFSRSGHVIRPYRQNLPGSPAAGDELA